jgi:hypothetical protein
MCLPGRDKSHPYILSLRACCNRCNPGHFLKHILARERSGFNIKNKQAEKPGFSAKAPQRKKIFNSAIDSEKNGENGRYLKKYGDI